MGNLSRQEKNPVEESRQSNLEETFETLQKAFLSLEKTEDKADEKLDALRQYQYQLGKCEYKTILGIQQSTEDCSEHAFSWVDPIARDLMTAAKLKK